MDDNIIEEILVSLKSGSLDIKDALKEIKHLSYEDISCAKIDHHRAMRQGIPEAILARGKKTEDVISIARSMYKKNRRFLITKATEAVYEGLNIEDSRYYSYSGMITAGEEIEEKKGCILILSAGTSDIPIAEEAAVTAAYLGSKTEIIYDVGVAGLHRLMDNMEQIKKARVIIVIAGMEGALPSVVGGLTDKPVIAVPTSQGYGTSLGGLTALFAMLNSCVPGIAVMNIDNGFGAACLGHKINLQSVEKTG